MSSHGRFSPMYAQMLYNRLKARQSLPIDKYCACENCKNIVKVKKQHDEAICNTCWGKQRFPPRLLTYPQTIA
jgi:ribosomal protein L37AE/L43A